MPSILRHGIFKGFYRRCWSVEGIVVLTFFILLARYFSDIWNSPSLIVMRDNILTFDHWWYFHHRLREGAIAQWNPFYFLGSIAVQWDIVPVTIFTPFLVIFELTPVIFKNIYMLSGILALLSVYVSMRIIGYGGYLSIFAVICMLTSPVFMWDICSIIVIVMPFLAFPLAFGFMVAIADRGVLRIDYKWGFYGLFLALSITGSRFEYIVHEVAFMVFAIAVFGISRHIRRYGDSGRYVIFNLIVLFIAIAANSWHMTLTMNATLESGRVSSGHHLFSSSLWRWMSVTLLYQPYLIFAATNSLILLIPDRIWPSKKFAALIVTLELILIVVFVMVRDATSCRFIGAASLISLGFGSINLLRSIYTWICVAIGVIFWFMDKHFTLGSLIRFVTAVLCGLYLTDNLIMLYGKWPDSISPIIAKTVLFGCIGMFRKGNYKITGLLVLFFFFEMTLKYILYDVLGIIWIEVRDFVFVMGALAILAVEGLGYLAWGGKRIAEVLKMDGIIVNGSLFIYLLLVTATLTGYSLVSSISSLRYIVVDTMNFSLTRIPYHYQSVREARGKASPNPWQRGYLYNEPAGDFLYSYMGAKNVSSYLYYSEIPSVWWNMTQPYRDNKLNMWHPEASEQFSAYIQSLGYKFSPNDYHLNVVLINTGVDTSRLMRELTAMEGSDTRRAFLSRSVAWFDDYRAEYKYLDALVDSKGHISDRITTTEPDFIRYKGESGNILPIEYRLDFQRDDPEDIELRSESKEDGYLALMDTYSRGWKAYVDGVETKIYKGYIGMRFIRLSAGGHRIAFVYNCPNFRPAVIISSIMWIAIFGLNLYLLYRAVLGSHRGLPLRYV